MQVEQAIFTSAQTSQARGYHLVARSSGIDDEMAQQLALWAPSESSLIDRNLDAESLNFFPVGEQWAAVSRTIYAGAEYSDRGQFRIETNILVVGHDELAGYACDPLAIVRVAMASGYLRLRAGMTTKLSPVSLPDALGTVPTEPDEMQQAPPLVREIADRFADERLVVVGSPDPAALLQQVLRCLAPEDRLTLSFSTGLKPSTHRPFRLQFLPEVNHELARELESRGMKCLMA
jgi:hypothetical protein